MWDNPFTVNIWDHVLKFDGLDLIDARYEPDTNCFVDVSFGSDYFISGESGERIDITKQYRGLKGTRNYQVDVLVADRCIETFMVQTTPMGDALIPMDD